MHESLVSGDDCTEVKKKGAEQRKKGKETVQKKRMAKDGSGSVGARSGTIGGRGGIAEQGNERRGARRAEGKACLRKPTSDCIK